MKYFLTALLFLFIACKSKSHIDGESQKMENLSIVEKPALTAEKISPETTTQEHKSELIQPEFVKIVNEVKNVAQDLEFRTAKISTKDNYVSFDIAYGGGCVKPHIFELQTTGEINENGLMEIVLLHKTHDDLCKMMIMEKRTFDISPILTLREEKLNGFILNNELEYRYK